MKLTLRIPLVLLMLFAITSLATVTGAAAPAAEARSLTGVLGVTWADAPQGEGLPPRFDLYDADGNAFLLTLDDAVVQAAGGLQLLDGAKVTVQGEFDVASLDQNGSPAFVVSSVIPAGEVSAFGSVTGPKPWVIVMCKFSDNSSTPHGQAFFQGLFGSTFPGINDYWQRVSYGSVNLNGTTVMPAWVTLPHPRSYYIGSGANLQALTNDCTGLVDASVNFAEFTGVSLMFNGDLDGYAWGGTTYLNRDGINIIRATWMPPWGYENQNIMAHEVGHGFGLTHSSGPYDQTYDSPWDVMSSWPPCNGHSDPNYGCIGVETISYHRNLLGWMPSNRIFTAAAGANQDLALERLGQPTNAAGSFLMAIIPIQGSSTRFYTVESRKYIDSVEYTDYEEELIGQAVVIHLVDTTRTTRTAQVVDADNDGDPKDAGSMWTLGETFQDNANRVYVEVLRTTDTGYVINIRNGAMENDNFSTATRISAYPFAANLDTPSATTQGSDPVLACANSQGVSSVWYRFTPATKGRLNASTVGSNYDTLLALWTGSSGSLTSQACDDDSGGNGASFISAAVVANTTYYIEVAGKSNAGNLNFNLSFTPCYKLTTSASPSGTVTADPPPNCGNSSYEKGTSIQLAASPAADRVFSAWSGALSGSDNPAAIAMNADRTVTANFVPVAPAPVSPTGGAIASTLRPTLDWTDVSGASYSVQYSRYSNYSSATTISTSASATQLTSSLATNTKYYWRTRSKVNGLYSAWSTSDFMSPNPPAVPVLLSPANGAGVSSLQPSLDWKDSTNYPEGYQIQLSTEKTLASPLFDTTSASSSYLLSQPLSSNTRYYWRVRAFNASGQYSSWSSVFSFGTRSSAPELLKPVAGVAVSTLRPRFDWSEPPGGARSYTIQIARDSAFHSLLVSATVTPREYRPTVDMPRDEIVYWRVLSTGTYAKSPYSTAETFVGANPPTTPSLLAPANLATISSYVPTLDWSDSLPEPNTSPLSYTAAAGYQLQVATSSQFSKPIIDTLVPSSSFITGSNLAVGTYYWRVRSYNAESEYSNWTSTVKFYTRGGATGVVWDALSGTPLAGATIQVVGTPLLATSDASGAYTLTAIPAGTRTLSVSSPGRISTSGSLAVANGALSRFSTALLPSGAPTGQYRIVLFWENGPTDLDAHFWLPTTTPNHIRWDNPGVTESFPSAALLADAVRPYGVETIQIDQLYSGTTTFGVYNYSNDTNLRNAKATVWIYNGDTLTKTIRQTTSGSYRWWKVFSLSSTGSISVSNRIVSSAPGSYDKSGGTGPK